MNNLIEYKGYTGSVEFSPEDALFYGKVMGVRALISYEGGAAQELLDDFHNAVDEYLQMCEETGAQPERPYKGSFNVRVDPELHRESALYAVSHQMTLNAVVEAALKQFVAAGRGGSL